MAALKMHLRAEHLAGVALWCQAAHFAHFPLWQSRAGSSTGHQKETQDECCVDVPAGCHGATGRDRRHAEFAEGWAHSLCGLRAQLRAARTLSDFITVSQRYIFQI